MVENVNIWGRKQQNREEKLQFWATNPEIAEIFHSSANFFFGSGAVSFPKPQKAGRNIDGWPTASPNTSEIGEENRILGSPATVVVGKNRICGQHITSDFRQLGYLIHE